VKRYVVIGLGNFGSSAAQELQSLGHDVVAVDLRESVVDALADSVARAVVGDGTNVEVLERAGARDADAAVVSTGDDITASVLAVLALKDCGVKDLYVKIISQTHGRVMAKLEVCETIFPEQESAVRLAKRIATQKILNFVELGPGFFAQEMAVPTGWIGRSLRQLQLPSRHGISVIAVHDFLLDEFRALPNPDAPLKDSDSLLIAGPEKNLARVMKLK